MMPSSTRQPKKNRRLNIFNAIAGSLCCWRRDVRPMPVALEKGSEEPRRATAESWFLKLPPKVFNVIAGFLDIPSLLQLAKTDPKAEKLVRDSEKHWKYVFVTSDIFCIDYECCDKHEAEILLVNAKIDNYKEEESVADARELIELPTELVEMILEPLEFLSLLEVEKCHKRLDVLGRRIPVKAVHHSFREFHICSAGFEPQWRLAGPEWRSPPSSTILERKALDGRHVETVIYEPWSVTESFSPKVKPRFTCTNLLYLEYHRGTLSLPMVDCYLDMDIVQNCLKPYDIWTSVISWHFSDTTFPRGTLVFEYADQDDAEAMRGVQSPRFAFQAADADEWLCKVLYHYIDEWMVGHREIETIWLCWQLVSHRDDVPDYDGFVDFVLPGLVNKYGFSKDSEGIVRGQLLRDDGKMLDIRARREDVVLQAPGAAALVLSKDWYGIETTKDSPCQMPVF